MGSCDRCGHQNEAAARFCSSCGAQLSGEDAARKTRRRVTVVFCDLAGSTGIGERLDPELLRDVMRRYYEAMRAVLERHGGRVEKFIGDAVVAVFGLPIAHEDDALRALRAAVEMRDSMVTLNKELERDHGLTLTIRQGINSGEVLWAGAEALGDPINVAARLQQRAQSGEILVGEETRRMVRDAASLDALDPLEIKGKAAPVAAWRLREILPDAEAIVRRLDSPMVGRDRELALLRDAFSRAATERACHLFTVLGSAGVGKSRLVREFEATLAGDATVLRGRCLPYGQGITYWPLRDIVAQAAGLSGSHSSSDVETRIAALVDDDRDRTVVARTIAGITGSSVTALSADEVAWAVRRFFESIATERPTVVIIEDIHWAEPTMLDLIDHIADLSRDRPLLLLCPARPDLLDVRRDWGGGKSNATAITLEPLSEAQARVLIENLLGELPMPVDLAGRIADAAGGTPLFVEEMIGMLIDEGKLSRKDGRWTADGIETIRVPPSIHALLAARLDRLDPAERLVLERAAVVGREHWRSAVASLLPEADRSPLSAVFASLVRKDLVRPERSSLPGHDAYRFRHILIQEAAYESLPKADRADMHERFAAWLDEHAPEHDDIAAYHLEQAALFRRELNPSSDAAHLTAFRAATRLAAVGRRALHRGDIGAANLLSRAVALFEPDAPQRASVQIDHSLGLAVARSLDEQLEALDDAIRVASASGNRSDAVRADLLRRQLLLIAYPRDVDLADIAQACRAAIDEFAQPEDHSVLGMAWDTLSQTHNFAGRYGPAAGALSKAAEHAAAQGDELRASLLTGRQVWVSIFGPTPIPEVEVLIERTGPVMSRSRVGECVHLGNLGFVQALRGRFDEARATYDRAHGIAEQMGAAYLIERLAFVEGPTEMLAGNPEAAEEKLRPPVEWLRSTGDRSYYSTLVVLLADAVIEQGRVEEAIDLARAGAEAASAEDLATQVAWRGVRAKGFAEQGRLAEAEALARDGAELAGRSDVVIWQCMAAQALAVVLRTAGRNEEARSVAAEALRMMRAKGSIAHAAQIEQQIAALPD